MTVPNVQEFERIEQHPFLHVVINLLIGPKAWSSIDLPERREEKHSKNILGVFFLLHLIFFFLLNSANRNAMQLQEWISGIFGINRSVPTRRRGKRKEDGRKRLERRGYFSLSRTLWNA